YEREARSPEGGTRWVSVDLSPFRDASGAVLGVFSCTLEVRELKRTNDALGDALEQLRMEASNDALTGLPNRNSLAARLDHAIVHVNRAGDRLALLFIDLDRFKKVNDT